MDLFAGPWPSPLGYHVLLHSFVTLLTRLGISPSNLEEKGIGGETEEGSPLFDCMGSEGRNSFCQVQVLANLGLSLGRIS